MEKRKPIEKNGKVIVKIVRASATVDANSACVLFAYQPNEPDAVKKLRKF